MPDTPPSRPSPSSALALAATFAACGGGPAGQAGPPAVPVEVVTLAERPVQQSTEYVGVVKSRHSTAVQPEVEGLITRILVRSGDRVAPGAPLMEVDPRMQKAAVASLESQLAAREADLQLARQEAERMRTLLEAGAASEAEAERAETALATARAQAQAAGAQLDEQRVALAYHTVSAPTAGVVGDVPVRVGDRVTRSTRLTTIDRNAGLELYINVPVQEADRLEEGLPVQLVGEDGDTLAAERLFFVSPSVDGATQSVLVKATLEETDRLRTGQFVRARVVWSERPSLTVPVVALHRLGGQHFAFVVEEAEEGSVARQRPVGIGPVVGNDYVLESGLEPGARLIVSGVQRVSDGSRVEVVARDAAAAGGEGR